MDGNKPTLQIIAFLLILFQHRLLMKSMFSKVGLMCPMMSLIATILYDGISIEFFSQ
jgi:hypothetical protein